jgi:UDP-N-acetylglucosamine--N-acetylmuramyl-(pentapeptide) pyrophosphoryl-undecaprenol N-acetylglucosamine transferase
MRTLIAAGGTGGHIYPALAVASQLIAQRPDIELRWLGARRGLEGDLVPAAGLPLQRLWLRSLRTVDASLATLLDPLRLLASFPQALALLLRWRPDVIYSTGGYVAIPVLVAAALLRIPSVLWDGNAVPGRSVRAVARLATVRAVSAEAARARLPVPTYLTGTPIRHLGELAREAARARLDLPLEVPVMLVFGGSQSVQRFDEAMADAVGDIVTRAVIVHVTGEASFPRAEALRARLPADLVARYRPVAFLRDEMAVALAAADLLVGRAGASTLAEAAAAGLPMIVVPYPHAAAHQRRNAAEMVDAGAALLVADEDFDGTALRQAADLVVDEARLATMAAASRSLGRPGAAAANVALLDSLVEGRPLPDEQQLERRSRAAA